MANNFPYYGGKMYECPEGCLDGKCNVPKNETSYCDDAGYCKLYEGEYLIFDEVLSVNTDYIYEVSLNYKGVANQYTSIVYQISDENDSIIYWENQSL